MASIKHTQIIRLLLAMALTAMQIKMTCRNKVLLHGFCSAFTTGIPELAGIGGMGVHPMYFCSSFYLLDPSHPYSRQLSDGVKYMMIAWYSESLGGAVRAQQWE